MVGLFRGMELVVVPCQHRWKYKELVRELRSNDASVDVLSLTVEERGRQGRARPSVLLLRRGGYPTFLVQTLTSVFGC